MSAGYIGSLSITRLMMSFMPAPPRIHTPLMPFSVSACSAPRAMSSSDAQIAVTLGFLVRSVSVTSSAFWRFQFAACWPTILMPGSAANTALAALTRSVFTVQGMPSRTMMSPFALPLPPSFSTMNSALLRPNALLSPSMKMSAAGLRKPRSTFTM